MFAQPFNLACYCCVRLRKTPLLPTSIAWSSACRLSRLDRPPPRRTRPNVLLNPDWPARRLYSQDKKFIR